MLRQLLIFLHLAGAIAWLGGMFFAHFCLRPAALEVLDPPKRLPLMAATFARFLPYTAVAVLTLDCIRRLVMLNLFLGACTVVAAVSAR
jgi:uncharacterized membrane protein